MTRAFERAAMKRGTAKEGEGEPRLRVVAAKEPGGPMIPLGIEAFDGRGQGWSGQRLRMLW